METFRKILVSFIMVLVLMLLVPQGLHAASGEETVLASIERAANDDNSLNIYLEHKGQELANSVGVIKMLEMNQYELKATYTEVRNGEMVIDHEPVTDRCEFSIWDETQRQYADIQDGNVLRTFKPSSDDTVLICARYFPENGEPCVAYLAIQVVRLQLGSDVQVLTHAALSSLSYLNDLPVGEYIRDFIPTWKDKALDTKLSDFAGHGSATNRHFIMAAAGDYRVVGIESSPLGFYAVIFENPTAQHRVIAYRGTELKDPADLKSDFLLGVGATGDNQFSEAVRICNAYMKPNMSVTGHSLGGGLANYASLMTGVRSITFNAPSTFITALNTDLDSVAKVYSGLEDTHYRDYANLKDWIAAAGVGDNPKYDALTTLNFIEASRFLRDLGNIDRTYAVADQSTSNGRGEPGAPYHFFKQLIGYRSSEEEVFIDSSFYKTPDRTRFTIRQSDYRLGTTKGEYLSVDGSRRSILLGGNGDDTLMVLDNSAADRSNDVVTRISRVWNGSQMNVMASGAGNDILLGSTFGDTYVYTDGDGIDSIYDVSGKDVIRMPDHAITSISIGETGYGHAVYVNGSLVMKLYDRNGTGWWTIFDQSGSSLNVIRSSASDTVVREYGATGSVQMLIKDSAGNVVHTLGIDNLGNVCNEYGTFMSMQNADVATCYARITDPSVTVTIVGAVSVTPVEILRTIPRDADGPTFDFSAVFTSGDSAQGWSVTGIPVFSGSVYTTYGSYSAGILQIDYDGDGVKDMEPVYTPMTRLSIEESVILPYAESYQLTLSTDSPPKEGLLQWSSSDPLLVSVTGTGLITAHGFGTAEILLEALDGSGLTASCTVTVPEVSIDLADCAITLAEASFEYTGKPIIPEISAFYLETELLPYFNYNAEYADNTLPGTGSVTLTGVVPFGGEIVLEFEILEPKVPTLEEKVNQLVLKCHASGAYTDYDKTLWFHDWLTHNANYDYTYTEYYADGVLLKGTGVCQSYALALQMLLDAVGIENMVVVSHEMDHAWNLVKLEGSWCHVDCTWDDPGSGGGENYAYFGLDDTFMRRDHVWRYSSYPACTSLELNYYVHEGVYPCASNQEEFNAAILEEIAKGNDEITIFNTSTTGFDLWNAFFDWTETESWRFFYSSYSVSGDFNLLTVSFYDLDSSSGAVDYTGDPEAAKKEFELLLNHGCRHITVRDSTGGAFDPEAIFAMAKSMHGPLAAQYGSLFPSYYDYSYDSRSITLSMNYLDVYNMPEPFDLTDPKSGHTFSMYDSHGTEFTEQNFAGERVLHVYGRLTCPNTNALLSALNAASDLFEKAGVEVVVGLSDLTEGNLEQASEQYSGFHCLAAGYDSGLWEGLALFGYNEGSLTYPGVFIREPNGDLVYYSTGYVVEPLRLVATAVAGRKYTKEPTTLPSSLTEIGAEAFAGCTELIDVSLVGSNVQTIGDLAFAGCTNLHRIAIPASVTSISSDAFDGCTALTILCEPNSTAYWYAVTYQIRWEIIE